MSVRTSGFAGSYINGTDNDLEPLYYVSNSASDKIVANRFGNLLLGNGGTDRLYGLGGDDYLSGGDGRDIVTGGAGADAFVFDRALSRGGVDRVVDFARSQGDNILLSAKIFKGIDMKVVDARDFDDSWATNFDAFGRISKSVFRIGTAAADADDRFVYNKAKGLLYFDMDGNGSAAKIAFAQFNAGTTIAAADCLIY